MIDAVLRNTPLPEWVPYRLRRGWDNVRIDRTLAGVFDTAPLPAADPGGADAEVHLLLCRRDFVLGLVALKSLLRFADGRLALSVTDDGSLTADDRAALVRHFPGVRLLGRTEPAVEAALADFPRTLALYRGPYAPARKLCHAVLAARCGRVFLLDPDTAFLKRPDRLLDWAATGGPNLYLRDDRDEDREVPAAVRAAWAALAPDLGTGPARTPPGYDFDSGLLAFAPARFDLSVGERYLAARERLPAGLRNGEGAICFGDWTPEQTAYAVLFAAAAAPPEPFGPGHVIGRDPGATYRHYLEPYLRRPATLGDRAALVPSLPTRAAIPSGSADRV